MKARKILSAIIAIAIIATLTVSVSAADGVTVDDSGTISVYDGVSIDTSWYNTTDTEFTINSAAAFAGFAAIVNGTVDGIEVDNFKGKTIKLATDIDLNNCEWTPIGARKSSSEDRTIECVFDGQNHTIYNLKVTREATNEVMQKRLGLFGKSTSGKFVAKNFTIENVSLYGAGSAAAVLADGYSASKVVIDNVTVKGDIKIEVSQSLASGICGQAYGPVITNCKVIGNDGSYIKAGTYEAAGILGWGGEKSGANNTVVENCTVENITVSSPAYVSSVVAVAQYAASIKNNSSKNVKIDVLEGYENNEYYYGTIIGSVSAGSGGTSDVHSLPIYISGNSAENTAVSLNGVAIENPVLNGAHWDGTSYVSAKIGDAYYESLQTAITAASDVATELASVTIELLPGEFDLGTFTLPNMAYVTIKGAADKKSVIKNTLITNAGKSTDNIAHITFDGVAFDNSRIYLNGWTAGMNFADWTITNCEFKNLNSTTSIGGVIQFNLSSGMIVGQYGPYNDVALDGFTFTNNIVDGAHCNSVCSAINSQAMEGTIVIENNTFNDIDYNAIQLQNVPETATVSIKNNTISNAGNALIQLNNNLADIEISKNVLVTADGNQLYISHISTEIDASENFFGTGTSVENAVFNENYAEKMRILNSDIPAPVVTSYYKDAELTEKVTVAEKTDIFGEQNAYINDITYKQDNADFYSVILLAGIDSLNYREVGFKVTVDGTTKEQGTNTVYTSILASDASGAKITVKPDDFGTKVSYIFGQRYEFDGKFKTSALTFCPYAIDTNGNYIYGEEATIEKIYSK